MSFPAGKKERTNAEKNVYIYLYARGTHNFFRLLHHQVEKLMKHNPSTDLIFKNKSLPIIFNKDAPFCRPGQHRVYGVARHEEARITCDLDANPASGLQFRWLFNSSAGVIELPTSTWTADGSRSVARYLPSSDLDFGSLLCSASNAIGQQAASCLFHVIPAGKEEKKY